MNKLQNKILKELSFQTGKYFLMPEFLSLIVTGQCNFRCRSCSIWQNPLGYEMNEEEWIEVIKKIVADFSPETFVEINGGEPLIRRELVLSLIKELKNHFKKVALNSNGLLINENTVKELREAGLDTVKISFYSLMTDIHNYLRGHEKAFEHAQRAIEMISKGGLGLEVGILITKQNIKELPMLIKYLQTLPNTAIILQPLDEKVESVESKDQSGSLIPSELWPEATDVEGFFSTGLTNTLNIKNSKINLEAIKNYYLNPKSALNFRCFAGQRNFVVYPNGDSSFCFKGKIIGNVLKQYPKDVLMNAIEERLRIKTCGKYCRIIGCNFSRGLKEVLKNKLFKI